MNREQLEAVLDHLSDQIEAIKLEQETPERLDELAELMASRDELLQELWKGA